MNLTHTQLLEKHTDFLCIGRNLTSFLLSVRLLKRKQSVLLLDDRRFQVGASFMYAPRQLEMELLRTFGEYEQLECLCNLEHYAHQTPYFLGTGKQRLFLGQRPHENFLELARKLPHFFQLPDYSASNDPHFQNEFDEIYHSTVRRLATSAHQFLGPDQLNFELFMTQCPQLLKDIYSSFQEAFLPVVSLESVDNESDQEWAYLFRAQFHHHLDLRANSLELFHLFLSLLSPQYRLDRERLHEQLLVEHLKLGGQYKSTWVREWKFEHGRPWSVELASFDGIIHPNKIGLHGMNTEALPLIIDHGQLLYREVLVKWELREEMNLGLGPYELTYTTSRRIGSDFPIWKISQQGRELLLSIPMREVKGDKLSFQQSAVRQILRNDLEHCFGLDPKTLVNETMKYGEEVWTAPIPGETSQNVFSRGNFDLPTYYQHRPHELKKIKNLCYIGPLGSGRLGLFSTLLTLREAQIYL